MSEENSAATDPAGANSDEFHSADEADGSSRSPPNDAGGAPNRRARASSSSSSGSDSEPEANRATLSSADASAQQSESGHGSSQPEAMQGESASASAAPPSETDEREKLKDTNDAKSESSATEADRSPPVAAAAAAVVDSTSAESTERVSDLPAQNSEEPVAEAHLTSDTTTAETKTPEHKTDKLADTEAVTSALGSCSLTESERTAEVVNVESSSAAAAENGVHIESAGAELGAVNGHGHIPHCDEGPSILSSKDDPRVSPRPPHEQQDNAHVMELNDDGQYDDDDDDDDDDGEDNDASGEGEATPDDDEDVHNPAFIPKVGRFYMHDRRTYGEDEEADKKEARPGRADAVDKWTHDRFEERSQRPKDNNELVHRYGRDIRGDEKPPEGDDFPPRTDNRRARGAPPRGSRGRPPRSRGATGHPPQQRRGGGAGGFDASDFPPLQSRSNEASAGDSYQQRGRGRGTSSSGYRGSADRRGGGFAPRRSGERGADRGADRGTDRRPDDPNHPVSYQTRVFRNSGAAASRGAPSERGSYRDSHREAAPFSNRPTGDRRNFDNARDSQPTRHAHDQRDGPRKNEDSRGGGHQHRGEGQQSGGGRGGGKRYSAQRPQQHQTADGAQEMSQQEGGGQFPQPQHVAFVPPQQQPYYEPNYQRPPPFGGPPMQQQQQQQYGGQYVAPAGGAAAYAGPQEMYHSPPAPAPAPYMGGPGGQPRQPTGAVYFDPGQQRERPSHQGSRPHKGIPIVAPDESAH